MKPLPKHLRPRWRYLAVRLEAWADASFDRGDFQRAIWYAAGNLLGDPGSADAELSVVRFRMESGTGAAIIRTRRGEVDAARAVVACVESVDSEEVGLRVSGVSGTIRACEESYLGGAGGRTTETEAVFAGTSRHAWDRNGAVDVRMPDGFVGVTDWETNAPDATADTTDADG